MIHSTDINRIARALERIASALEKKPIIPTPIFPTNHYGYTHFDVTPKSEEGE